MKKVAIIGGGFAAMAAAWDLTTPKRNSPDAPAQEPCEVTIFQIGGRLGGKAASSRNRECGDRIEEHGLHLFLGYYENAFRMVRRCYEELKTLESSDPEVQQHVNARPFNNWDWLAAFERANLVGLADDSSGTWTPWIARFPEYVPRCENGVTGIYQLPDGTTLPGVHIVDDLTRAYPGELGVGLEQPNVAFFLTHALRELQAFVESLELRIDDLCIRRGSPPPEDPDELLARALNVNPITEPDALDWLVTDIPRALRTIRLSILVPAIQAIATIARLSEGPVPYTRGQVVALLDRFIDDMREKIETFVQRDPPAQRMWELIDLLAANIRGLIAAGLEGRDDFSSLDDWNYEDWLRFNRIGERTLRNPIIRGAHDLAFAYRRGNVRNPQFAAGQAINAGCHFFFMYKGALFWRMKAGAGDVVFAPMYLALRARGVKFRFFHRLDDIELNDNGTAVTKLHFRQQVKLRRADRDGGTNYEPLISVAVNGHTIPGWPETPHVDQFAFDDATRTEYENALKSENTATDVNFESVWCNWPHSDLFATVGEQPSRTDQAPPSWIGHFDAVVVTVPIAALPLVSKQLVAAQNDAGRKWKTMLDRIRTVATQSAQLWVTKSTHDLGWAHGQVSFSGFVHPFDTWADLSQLIKVENQPEARGVHYFCSVLPEPDVHRTQDRDQAIIGLAKAKKIVKQNVRNFLDDWVFHIWQNAADRYPNAFKWDLLVDQNDGPGDARLDAQHFVANVDPSERYTLSLPGTTQHRIRPDETGFEHLYIAGDWTNCGLNFGCLEAAVISGRLASSAIRGFPDTRFIPGFVKPERAAVAEGESR
jgi:uncharacterized protein with NAD-binding domain and iron-sulfur cluster